MIGRVAIVRSLRQSLARFVSNRAGNVAIFFALGAPIALFAGGAGVDYARILSARTSLQSVADGAALAGAQSLRLAGATSSTVGQVVTGFVNARVSAAASPVTTGSSLINSNTTVAVQLDQTVQTIVGKFAGVASMHLTVKAQARLAGGASLPTCMVALDPSASGAASVDMATVQAPGCLIVSNSAAADSIKATNGASVSSGRTCSHGGVKLDSTASIAPAAQTDCPAFADPLAARAQPAVGGCTQTNLKLASGSTSLSPGVYCGGLEIGSGVIATLLAGTYIIKDGQLRLKADATLSGTDITIFLTGSNATLSVENKSTVSLTAPSTGPMAGMLIFEDRAAATGQAHKFESRNAPNMLGTIYLPQGTLQLGVKGGGGGAGIAVGATSAWTIIVARQISVTDQQTLALNVNYNATSVPAPTGFLPGNGAAQLTQ